MSSEEIEIDSFDRGQRLRYNAPKYSHTYIRIKSILMVLTWIVFGINFELIGITLEDLKIYLDIDYTSISFGLVLRNVGYLSVTILLGFVFDKISYYSDLLMAIASALIALTNLLMPVTKSYQLSMFYFLTQGLSQSIYDLTGISIIIKLWKNIDGSPINALQGGYGIGACIATQLAKPFLTYRSDISSDNLLTPVYTLNASSSPITRQAHIPSDNITLKTPYWTAACLTTIISFFFLISQCVEAHNDNTHTINKRNYLLLIEDSDLEIMNDSDDIDSKNAKRQQLTAFERFFQKLLFSDKIYKGRALFYMLSQIFLFIFLFVFSQGSFTILSRFMFTYLTRGPANLNTEEYATIGTIFWLCVILSRFLAVYFSIKFKPIQFFLFILIQNVLVSIVFLSPTIISYFYWLIVPLLGIFAGPIMPCGLMIAKNLLQFNSFILSIFIVGLAMGGIIFQELTGELLDQSWPTYKNSSFIIPYLTCLCNLLSLVAFLPIHLMRRNHNFFFK